MDYGDFKDKVVIVTGGTAGIGEASVRLYHGEGARVAVVGRSEERGTAVVRGITEEGGRATFIRADVSDPGEAKKVVAETIKAFGRIDVLFNNAGVDLVADVCDTSVEDLVRVIRINLMGTFLLTQAAYPELKKRWGVILNNASGAGLAGNPGISAYTASKGGVVMMTKSMAAEFAPEVRVNCLCPGYIKTPMHDRAEGSDPKFDTEVLPRLVPLGRIGRAEEVAHAALFLTSEKSSYITGVALAIDGGLNSFRSREA